MEIHYDRVEREGQLAAEFERNRPCKLTRASERQLKKTKRHGIA
jgi:hypothetical protein